MAQIQEFNDKVFSETVARLIGDAQESEFRYLAGFFDGEGSVGITGGSLCVRVVNSYRPVLERFQRTFGGSIGVHRAGDAKSRLTWVWRIYGADAESALRHLLPHLHEKRAQAYLGVHSRSLPKGFERSCVDEALSLLKKVTHYA